MSSILDLTVKDMLGLMVEGGGTASKFVARDEHGTMMLVVGIAYDDAAEDFEEVVEEFLQRDGVEPSEIDTLDVDEAKARVDAMLTATTPPKGPLEGGQA